MKINYITMEMPKRIKTPEELPQPEKTSPDILPARDPEEPVLPVEPDFIPDEDPDETPPPFEIPAPGEGP